MKKAFFILYSAACYLIFFATILYLIGFTENLFVPKSIDNGATTSAPVAILINLALISLFVLQHSIMVSQGFKNRWAMIVPASVERSTHVLFVSILIILLLFFWKPVPYVLWNFSGVTAGTILTVLSFGGWGLFVLQQVYHRTLSGHPLYLGLLIAFWAAPVITVGHFLFSISVTAFIFISIYQEEKELIQLYGRDYRLYRQRTSRILPFIK